MNRSIFLTLLLCVPFYAVSAEKGDWERPDPESVRTELSRVLNNAGAELPAGLSGTALFEHVIAALRSSSEPVRNFLEICDDLAWKELPFGQKFTVPPLPEQIPAENKYLRGSLRFYLALRLVQARLYDEADDVLGKITPEESIDPAGVLAMRAIMAHHFSDDKRAGESLAPFYELAENGDVPRRYTELAKLIPYEKEETAGKTKPQKPEENPDTEKEKQDKPGKENEKPNSAEDPQKIAKKMDDVRRRLGKGRADDGTQKAEKDVLESLDKLIEQVEKQAKNGQQGQQPGQQQQQQSANPAQDSEARQLKAPGNVNPKDLLQGTNWGNLSPKEREEALLKIEKEFPSYYRDIIEQYFREMAK
ncbi:MAG: hypothetical protein LBH00_11855 [Planctomycetaceae bacterium]|jgi:hypothetical protein|nr:hypothetical protein [Planctomycetaceae bacterium]